MNWIVRALFPTPPPPTTTSLYIFSYPLLSWLRCISEIHLPICLFFILLFYCYYYYCFFFFFSDQVNSFNAEVKSVVYAYHGAYKYKTHTVLRPKCYLMPFSSRFKKSISQFGIYFQMADVYQSKLQKQQQTVEQALYWILTDDNSPMQFSSKTANYNVD